MKNIFPEYYKPTDEGFKNLWENCIFVFDTNVLLDLYRYSLESRNDFFAILENEKISERLWLPFHVAYEFQKNRLDVIIGQKNQFVSVEKSFTDGVGKLVQDVREKADQFNNNKLKRDPVIDVDRLLAALTEAVNTIRTELNDQQNALQSHNDSDVVREKLDVLFHNKIGDPFDKKTLEKVCQDGKDRFVRKKPPGYIDYDEKIKGSDRSDVTNAFNQFGDLILWKQILEKGKSEKKMVVFVTGDVKEDWFQRIKGQTVGPQPELLKEF